MAGLLGLLPQQQDPLTSLLGQYYNPQQARMAWLGGTLQGVGAGLASGRPGAWAQGLALGGGQGLDNYRQQSVLGYGLEQRKNELDYQHQQDAANNDWRQKQWDYQTKRQQKADAMDTTRFGWEMDAHDNPGPDTKAPPVQSFYDDKGQEYKAQWNAHTQTWDRIGGSKAAPNNNGITITNPDGSVTQIGGTGKPMTESQSKDVSFATRAQGALGTFDSVSNSLTSPMGAIAGYLPGGNYLKSPDYQKAEQAGHEFLTAILRKDSGAVIGKDEMAQYGSIYLPQPGDSAEVLIQKKDARNRAVEALKAGMPPQAILAQEQALQASGGSGQPMPNAAPQIRTYNPNTGNLE